MNLFEAGGQIACPCCGGTGYVTPAELPALSDPAAAVPGGARNTDPDTSQAARFAELPRKATQRRRVLEAHLRRPDGLTDDELEQRTGIRLNSVTTRRSECLAGGWLVDSGRRRRTRAGELAVVWVLTLRGRAELQRSWAEA